MPNIKNKTPGQLIDELFTCDHRCWEAQDSIRDLTLNDRDRLKFAEIAQEQNARRTELIRAIDELLGFGVYSNTTKSYNEDE